MTQIDRAIEDLLESNPLLVFSCYTHGQVSHLIDKGEHNLQLLDQCFTEDSASASLNDSYHNFWLWLLGAYEVVRTMSAADDCFDDELLQELQALKATLASLRMPFAKQEHRGRRRPIGSEISIYTVSVQRRDFSFKIGSEFLWVRDIVQKFINTMSMISRHSVRKDLRCSTSWTTEHGTKQGR
jgi:hypothetical protein